MSRWQSVETAPKDGRAFLAVDRFGDQWICVNHGYSIVGLGCKAIVMAEQIAEGATHWMPLPAPPPDPPKTCSRNTKVEAYHEKDS